MIGLLSPAVLRAVAVAAILAALAWGYHLWADHQREIGRVEQLDVDQIAINKIKADAAMALEAETALVRAAEDHTEALKRSLEVAREKAQSANRDAVAARAAGQRLRFASETSGCRVGSDSAKAAPDSPASDAGTAYVELPEPVNRRLWELAGKAESLAIDYRVLYEWANTPGMVCTVPATVNGN